MIERRLILQGFAYVAFAAGLVAFSVWPTYRPLPADQALLRLTMTSRRRFAFRIGREALANAVRHAGATRIEIMVDFGTTLLTLRIGDNGRGFETSRGQEAQRPGHWGLAGMRERARRAGGSCEVGNRRGGGTLVTAVLPLPGSVTGGESRAGGQS